MMTLYQYNALDKTDQACVLWNKGVFLGERTTPEHCVVLYQIEGFYVEVLYNSEQNKIDGLRSFCTVNQLKPYLDQMDIAKLL